MNNKEISIPEIGYGTWKITDEQVAKESIKIAINNGYRLIDTATAYNNENIIGDAILAIDTPREELFISGKLWNSDRGYENVLKAFDKTIKNLKVDYLDSYLIHWPASFNLYENWKEINSSTWKAFEKLYKEGLIKYIGVCNCFPHHLEAIETTANIMPMINQIEFHPGFMQNETYDYCKEKGIIIEAWSPLGSGKMMKKDILKEYAEKYNKSVAQICLRWCIQNGVVPLPKSKTADRIIENIDIFNFDISKEDMDALNGLAYIGGSGLNPDEITIFG